MRDIDADYRRSYIAEYEAYVQRGNDTAAAKVAQILRDHYGHEVAPDAPKAPKPAEAPLERADEKAPETVTPAAPKRKKGKR